MASTTQPWADTPFPLVSIPGDGVELSKVHESVFIAREMAFAHNCMIRCLNSIYQQCIHVSAPTDIADILKYAQFWCSWIHEHHKAEEDLFFPKVEAITGVKGLMETNVAQHNAFEPGLLGFESWVEACKVEDYDGLELRRIIDSFGGTLTQHLTDEIQTLLELKIYDGPALKKVYDDFDLELRKGDKVSFSLVNSKFS